MPPRRRSVDGGRRGSEAGVETGRRGSVSARRPSIGVERRGSEVKRKKKRRKSVTEEEVTTPESQAKEKPTTPLPSLPQNTKVNKVNYATLLADQEEDLDELNTSYSQYKQEVDAARKSKPKPQPPPQQRPAFVSSIAVNTKRKGDASAADIRTTAVRKGTLGTAHLTLGVTQQRFEEKGGGFVFSVKLSEILKVPPERVSVEKVSPHKLPDDVALRICHAVDRMLGDDTSPAHRHRLPLGTDPGKHSLIAGTFQRVSSLLQSSFKRVRRVWDKKEGDVADELLCNLPSIQGPSRIEVLHRICDRVRERLGKRKDEHVLHIALLLLTTAKCSDLDDLLGVPRGTVKEPILDSVDDGVKWVRVFAALLAQAEHLPEAVTLPCPFSTGDLKHGGWVGIPTPVPCRRDGAGDGTLTTSFAIPIPGEGKKGYIVPPFTIFDCERNGGEVSLASCGVMGRDQPYLGSSEVALDDLVRIARDDLVRAENRIGLISKRLRSGACVVEVVVEGMDTAALVAQLSPLLVEEGGFLGGSGSFRATMTTAREGFHKGPLFGALLHINSDIAESIPHNDVELPDCSPPLRSAVQPVAWGPPPPGVDLSLNGSIAWWRRGEQSTVALRGNTPMTTGKHRFAMRVVHGEGEVAIGVAAPSSTTGPKDLEKRTSWLFKVTPESGVVTHGDYKALVGGCEAGDVIEVVVDFDGDNPSVWFMVNGKAVPIPLDAFRGVPPKPPLVPAVVLHHRGQVVEILDEVTGAARVAERRQVLTGRKLVKLMDEEESAREAVASEHCSGLAMLTHIGGSALEGKESEQRTELLRDEEGQRGLIADQYRQQWWHCPPEVKLSNNNLTMQCTGDDGCFVVRALKGFSTGKHYWEIRLDDYTY
eukprot:Sspe_Gene.72446::Locus_43243_Transcript_1_1_Confidence_1.000_Length_2664::g.72446::m.72446